MARLLLTIAATQQEPRRQVQVAGPFIPQKESLMLISFVGTLAGVTANLLKDEAKLTISCRQQDMDVDVLDGSRPARTRLSRLMSLYPLMAGKFPCRVLWPAA